MKKLFILGMLCASMMPDAFAHQNESTTSLLGIFSELENWLLWGILFVTGCLIKKIMKPKKSKNLQGGRLVDALIFGILFTIYVVFAGVMIFVLAFGIVNFHLFGGVQGFPNAVIIAIPCIFVIGVLCSFGNIFLVAVAFASMLWLLIKYLINGQWQLLVIGICMLLVGMLTGYLFRRLRDKEK
jgi:hypothetical protein